MMEHSWVSPVSLENMASHYMLPELFEDVQCSYFLIQRSIMADLIWATTLPQLQTMQTAPESHSSVRLQEYKEYTSLWASCSPSRASYVD